MSVVTTGIARIQHASTDEIYEIEPEELNWQAVGATDREMGVEVKHVAEIVHPQLGDLSWTVFEYPVGAFNDRETDVGPHRLAEDFTLSLGDLADEFFEEDEERETLVEAMVDWFNKRFENPAESTAYISAEGGYQWVLGGPYDAREELEENFPQSDEELISAAVGEIEGQGVSEWAPRHVAEIRDDNGTLGAIEDHEFNEVDTDTAAIAEELNALLAKIDEASQGPIFGRDDGGRFELLEWRDRNQRHAFTDPILEDLRGAVRDLLFHLNGTNAHQQLLRAANQYSEAVLAVEVNISRVYSRGVMLENSFRHALAAVDADELPPLGAESHLAITTSLDLHAAYVMADPEGRALADGATAYRLPSDTVADLRRAATNVVRGLEGPKSIFGPEAQSILLETTESIGTGPHPERSTQTFAGTFVNFLKGIGKFISGAAVPDLLMEALKTSVPGAALVHWGAEGFTGIWSFLIAHVEDLRFIAAMFGADTAWLTQLAHLVASLRRRMNF